ncbi:MAG: hypothetical protein JW982_07630 [Spirochaetes bacterium]|nr:hypothetical protein [Spirochaetota bacterium]
MKTIKFTLIFFISVYFSGSLYALNYLPDQILERFYNARKFQQKTLQTVIAGKKSDDNITSNAEEISKELLYDYTVNETKLVSGRVFYAEVSVMTRTSKEGIRRRNEFWKIEKVDGKWEISNIFTPTSKQMKNLFRSGISLDEKVRILEKYEFEYQVEQVPPGTPFEKAIAYIQRNQLDKALYWLNVDVERRGSADSYFYRGIINVVLGNKNRGIADIQTAIKINPYYYYVLQDLLNGNSGGGDSQSSSSPASPGYTTMKGGVGKWFK